MIITETQIAIQRSSSSATNYGGPGGLDHAQPKAGHKIRVGAISCNNTWKSSSHFCNIYNCSNTSGRSSSMLAVQDLISLFEPKKTHCKPNKATSSVNHSALTAVATAKPAANELLLTVVSRLSGPHSLLHAGSRTFEDKETVMKEKMESNTSMIDCKIKLGQYVVASKDQQKAIAEFTHSPDKRHATFRGPPGSGKTLMMGSTIRIIIGKAKKKVFLILLSCGNNTPADQLHNFLDSETSSLPIDNCLIFPHNTSMKHFNLPSIP